MSGIGAIMLLDKSLGASETMLKELADMKKSGIFRHASTGEAEFFTQRMTRWTEAHNELLKEKRVLTEMVQAKTEGDKRE